MTDIAHYRAGEILEHLHQRFPDCSFVLHPAQDTYIIKGYLGEHVAGATELEVELSVSPIFDRQGRLQSEKVTFQLVDLIKQNGQRVGVTSRTHQSTPLRGSVEWLIDEIHKELQNVKVITDEV